MTAALTPDAERRQDRNFAWAVFGVLFVSYAYFYQAGGWNENSRMDLVRALVDDHTLHIDRYHFNTGDKARIGGHYYSDKAPGLSLAAVPTYAFVRLLRPFLDEHSFIVLASYLATVFTVGVGGALLGTLIFRACRRLGASARGSILASMAWGLGTTAFPFSTQLFSHQLAALLLFSTFYLLWTCRTAYSDRRSFAAALLGAAAVLTEFPTAPALLVLTVYHALGRERRRRRLLMFAVGAIGPAVLLLLYLTLAFGGPLSVGYASLDDPGSRSEMLRQGIFGVTYPRIGVLVELLIGRYRGLLPYSPVLILSVLGFAIGFSRTSPRHEPSDDLVIDVAARRELWVALGVIVYFLLFVASYSWWQGGSSFGSRHLIPMLPFAALPLGWMADLRPRLTFGAFLVSLAIMTIVTSVQPKPADEIENPFWRGILPAFVQGKLALGNICPLLGHPGGTRHRPFVRRASHDSFNLGMVLGGRRHDSLLPLVAIWVSAAYGFIHATSRRRRKPDADEVDGAETRM